MNTCKKCKGKGLIHRTVNVKKGWYSISLCSCQIPPKGTKVGLALSQSTKEAWANPNDKPAEDYAKK